jgi:phenylacetic acid degradation operon negative regulatory protein
MPATSESASALFTGRPQSLMLTLFGLYLLDGDRAVYSGSVIEVLGRLGVSDVAVRSTLTRMVKRQLLVRHPYGRKTYFGVSRHARDVLRDGYRRMWEVGAVNRDWDGTWTVVGFSLPDSRRAERHLLRSALTWEGFGPLQSGLWVAAGARDVSAIVGALGLLDEVNALSATAIEPTSAEDVVKRAFDTDRIAQGYSSFLQRWDVRRPLPAAADDLSRQLLLHADWLRLVREDPRLPAAHLPSGWPAIRAEKVFRRLGERLAASADPVAGELLDLIAVTPPPA